MEKNKYKLKKIIGIISMLFILRTAMPVNANLYLTEEEKNYIAKGHTIKAASSEGTAPFQYTDKKGVVRGISPRILEKISKSTGLIFEYKLYNSLEEIFASDYDMIFGISPNYATDNNLVLSPPYLTTETILYVNASVDASNLENKIYATIEGSSLPEGVKEENAIYYKTREESLNGIEAGEADYGYGNTYSVAFYTLQNGYKNIITIPQGIESREYSIGIPKENTILASIINKGLETISDSQIENLILDEASQIERKVTFSMVMHTYGKEIVGITSLVIGILLYSVIVNTRLKRELIIKNQIDGLTGLYNVVTTKERINKQINERVNQRINPRIKKSNEDLLDVLITMDCDKFKDVNDTYGHLIGDEVLKILSVALRETFREQDIIGRVGGDEFCAYMIGIDSIDVAKLRVQRLNTLIQEKNKDFYISVSAGIVQLTDERTYEELFKKADDALYEAKRDAQAYVYGGK